MASKKRISKKEEQFQTWLAKFRSTGKHAPVLLAKAEMTDDQLRELWKDAMRLLNRPVRKPTKPKQIWLG